MENVLENALTEAEQYVRECEELVRKQAALVDRLEKDDCPAAAEDAREALVMLEKDLDLARAHLRIEQAAYDAPLV
jgi:t-SNARE complex subunit (syntaxin)